MDYKPTKRKSFNFYRSYYDVFNELEPDDKLLFIEALFDKQFLDIDPVNLKGMVKFAYISQMDSIDKQVKGYCDKTKTALNPQKKYPWQGYDNTPKQGYDNINKNPTEQEKEKEEEKEEVEVKKEGTFHNVEKLIKVYLDDDRLCEAIISNKENGVKNKEHLTSLIINFKNELKEQDRFSETWKEFTRYFRFWLKSKKQVNKKASSPTSNMTF